MQCGIIVQARMSSTRLPQKMLRTLGAQPLISWVVGRLKANRSELPVIVATSNETSDHQIAEWCQSSQVQVFRGSLDDVQERYLDCMEHFALDAAVRVSGDSPFISPIVVDDAYGIFTKLSPDIDLISNVVNKTYPKGQSVELFTKNALQRLSSMSPSIDEREHVTLGFYSRPAEFRIESFDLSQSERHLSFVVDTSSDLERLLGFLVAHKEPPLGFEELVRLYKSYQG